MSLHLHLFKGIAQAWLRGRRGHAALVCRPLQWMPQKRQMRMTRALNPTQVLHQRSYKSVSGDLLCNIFEATFQSGAGICLSCCQSTRLSLVSAVRLLTCTSLCAGCSVATRRKGGRDGATAERVQFLCNALQVKASPFMPKRRPS